MSDYKYGLNAPHPDLESPVSKSWLFEIVDRKSGVVSASFTLILPPRAYTIKEPQRVSITKTFGNAFIDDYGPDNLNITLKGISGTAHVFPTFSTKGETSAYSNVHLTASEAARKTSAFGYNGRDAFYVFRDNIMRYKDKSGWEKKELRVFDLADEQAYKCVLLDFTLDRSSEQPLWYPFTISLFVYARLDRLVTKLDIVNISRDPIAALNDADSFLDKAKQLYKDVQALIDQVALLKAKTLELRTRYNKFLTQTTKILTSPLDIAKNFIDISFATAGIAWDTYQAGKYTEKRYIESSELFRATLNQGLKIYGYQISEGWQTSKTVSIEADAGLSTPEDITDPISRNVNLKNYEFDGLNVYTVKGEDTFQSIALNEMGDEDLWPYIAAVNDGLYSNDDLIPGNIIYIPIQTVSAEAINKEQFIITEDIIRDPYGTDIQLDSEGGIVIQENNDVALVSGIENVQQAIDLKLQTTTGSMIKQSAYGIVAQAGFAGETMALRYMKMAIRAALIQDPRIEAVRNLLVSLESDTVYISMDIDILGAETSLPVTVSL